MENKELTPADELVVKFVLKSLSKETSNAFRLMTVINYPIEDKQGFECQLDSLLMDSEEAKSLTDSAEHLRALLTPMDFPILGLQSGLEKLHFKLSNRFPSNPDLFIPDFKDTLQVPGVNVWRNYLQQFGPYCARKAIKEYVEIRDFADEITAYKKGQDAGKQCMRDLGLT